MATKAELVITALQQRIGEIVSNYETQIALLRADLTAMVEKEKAKEEYSEELMNKISNVEEE